MATRKPIPKKCPQCKTTDIIALARGKKGLCDKCYLYNYKTERKLRRKAFLQSLLGGECEECGESDPRVLAFHHIDPDQKTMNISQEIRDASKIRWQEIIDEVKTCRILCMNCHTRIHNKHIDIELVW